MHTIRPLRLHLPRTIGIHLATVVDIKIGTGTHTLRRLHLLRTIKIRQAAATAGTEIGTATTKTPRITGDSSRRDALTMQELLTLTPPLHLRRATVRHPITKGTAMRMAHAKDSDHRAAGTMTGLVPRTKGIIHEMTMIIINTIHETMMTITNITTNRGEEGGAPRFTWYGRKKGPVFFFATVLLFSPATSCGGPHPQPNLADGSLLSMGLLAAAVAAGQRLGINPFQAVAMLNVLQGRGGRHPLGRWGYGAHPGGRVRFGGMGGMGGMHGRRRFGIGHGGGYYQ